MKQEMRKEALRIGGMSCVSCQNKIERKLRGTAGIMSAEVSYTRGTADVEYDPGAVTRGEIADAITGLGYEVLPPDEKPAAGWKRGAGVLALAVAGFLLLRQFGLPDIFNIFPTAKAGMGYGMLFVIGLLTSVHCLAMCGGISLTQCVPQYAMNGQPGKYAALRPSFLYNLGRVFSYTAIGALVGALGSVISFTGAMRGAVQIAAGVFMVIMGVSMLGLFPSLRRLVPRMPRIFSRKITGEKERGKSPLYVGLLNGLMPCGPLQAMQLYALSTGSPVEGAVSMLLFSLGTVPLMFAFGALSSALSRKFTRKVLTVGAALVVVLGVSMFSQGWVLSGLRGPGPAPAQSAEATSAPETAAAQALPEPTEGAAAAVESSELAAGVPQAVSSMLTSRRYPNITVTKGTPVSWNIEAPQGSINGCNYAMVIPEYDIQHTFAYGDNIISFTPERAGTFQYSCWMGMITGTITVVEAGT